MGKLEGDSADSDTQLTKLDVVLTFQLEVSQNKDSKSFSQEQMNAYVLFLIQLMNNS